MYQYSAILDFWYQLVLMSFIKVTMVLIDI